MIYLLNPAIERPNVRFRWQPDPPGITEKTGPYIAGGVSVAHPICTVDAAGGR